MYASFFGFDDKPFSVTPDARFFYTNRAYQEAYANLLYGIRERKGFMMLSGEVGTGKTTILRRLMENLESTVPFVFFYNTTLNFEELLIFICEELSLKIEGGGQLARIQALNKFLIEQLRKGSTAVLFIDEAQNLRDSVFENLRLLSNLETSSAKLLQIVLAGQPELELKLGRTEMRQLRQRIFSHSRLAALGQEEVAAFIEYRLKSVGCEQTDLFARDAIRAVAGYSKGIPRLVNIICDNALLIAFAASKKRVSAEMIEEVARDLRFKVSNGTSESLRAMASQGWKQHNQLYHSDPRKESPRWFSKQSRGKANARPTSGGTSEVSPATSTSDGTPNHLDILTKELTEAMGPMAPIVIQTHIKSLGGSLGNVSKSSFATLVKLVSIEILNDVFRAKFQKKMSSVVEGLNENDINLH